MTKLFLLSLIFLSGQSQIIAHKPVNTGLNRKVLRLAREGTIEAAKEFFKGEEMPDINVQGRAGFTPLMFAVERGQAELAEMLIDNGALVNIQNDAGQTACIIAAQKGYANIVELLFDATADLNTRDNQGRTALINAILNGKLAAAVLLIQVKVDLNAQDAWGNTALIYATTAGQSNVVDLLIAAKANLNIQNNSGETALINAFNQLKWGTEDQRWAIRNRIISIIDAGADTKIKNNEGFTIHDLASGDTDWIRRDILKYLTK